MERPFRIKLNKRAIFVDGVGDGIAVTAINGTQQRPSHHHVPISQSFSTSVKIVVFGAAGLIAFLVIVSLALYIYRSVFLKKKKKKSSRTEGGLDSTDSTWSDKTLKEEEDRIRSAV